MSQTVLFIELLLVHYAVQIQTEVKCSEDVTLTCPDVDFNKLNFISVTWYKIHNEKRSGIIRKGKGAEFAQPYNVSRQVSIGEDYSLFMATVTPGDSGRYECCVNAIVGGQNLYRQVDLHVHDVYRR
ncbi:uncharacterized protein LOC121202353 isoform X2 [Betta splendens]|uniref:Uncharacterized protein LOC121202353 isoform X2 n=1 Tax=Betta splendens TaxID=158456 RepID=A0A8M1HGH7_BETSP|nr:uncharacterized protein LOC121202353 isoform X2 [Betta splendens]